MDLVETTRKKPGTSWCGWDGLLLGCGAGITMCFLATCGYTGHGFDVSLDAAECTKRMLRSCCELGTGHCSVSQSDVMSNEFVLPIEAPLVYIDPHWHGASGFTYSSEDLHLKIALWVNQVPVIVRAPARAVHGHLESFKELRKWYKQRKISLWSFDPHSGIPGLRERRSCVHIIFISDSSSLPLLFDSSST